MPSPSRPTHRSRTRRPPSRLIYLVGGGLIRLKRLVLISWARAILLGGHQQLDFFFGPFHLRGLEDTRRRFVAAHFSKVQPSIGEYIILRHALAAVVHAAERALCQDPARRPW